MAEILGKVIYFPRVSDPDFGYPQLIFVSKFGSHYHEGSRHEKMISENRRKFFPVNRCIDFSPEFWESCENYITKRQELDEQYKKFLKK